MKSIAKIITARIIMGMAVAFCIVVSGCGVNESQPSPPQPVANPFPNTVGNWWVYERNDLVANVIDTLTISVTGPDSVVAPEVPRVWTLTSSATGELLSNTVTVIGDTITVRQGNGLVRVEQFVLPFEKGRTWSGRAGEESDSSKVTGVGRMSAPAGSFPGSAVIERGWSTGFEGNGGWTITLVAPNVGIIGRREVYNLNDGGGVRIVINEIWTLLDYRIM